MSNLCFLSFYSTESQNTTSEEYRNALSTENFWFKAEFKLYFCFENTEKKKALES